MKKYKRPMISITKFSAENILSTSSAAGPIKLTNISDSYKGETGFEIQSEGYEIDWKMLN